MRLILLADIFLTPVGPVRWDPDLLLQALSVWKYFMKTEKYLKFTIIEYPDIQEGEVVQPTTKKGEVGHVTRERLVLLCFQKKKKKNLL